MKSKLPVFPQGPDRMIIRRENAEAYAKALRQAAYEQIWSKGTVEGDGLDLIKGKRP